MAIVPHDFVFEINDYDSDALNPVPVPTTQEKMVTDPKPGPSFEEFEAIHEEHPEQKLVEVQVISNNPTTDTESTRMMKTNNETVYITSTTNKKNLQNRSEEMRQTITQSNADFKRKQLEMMEVEHKLNIKIAHLKIKKKLN